MRLGNQSGYVLLLAERRFLFVLFSACKVVLWNSASMSFTTIIFDVSLNSEVPSTARANCQSSGYDVALT
jgi:hypothetical protein